MKLSNSLLKPFVSIQREKDAISMAERSDSFLVRQPHQSPLSQSLSLSLSLKSWSRYDPPNLYPRLEAAAKPGMPPAASKQGQVFSTLVEVIPQGTPGMLLALQLLR